MGAITTMTKIIGIPWMIEMTGDWDAKRSRMSRMTGLTGITTIMDKSPWDNNAIFIFFVSVPSKNSASFMKFSCSSPSPPPSHPIQS